MAYSYLNFSPGHCRGFFCGVSARRSPGRVGRGFADGSWGTPYRPKRGGYTLLRESAYLANKFAKLRIGSFNKKPGNIPRTSSISEPNRWVPFSCKFALGFVNFVKTIGGSACTSLPWTCSTPGPRSFSSLSYALSCVIGCYGDGSRC